MFNKNADVQVHLCIPVLLSLYNQVVNRDKERGSYILPPYVGDYVSGVTVCTNQRVRGLIPNPCSQHVLGKHSVSCLLFTGVSGRLVEGEPCCVAAGFSPRGCISLNLQGCS